MARKPRPAREQMLMKFPVEAGPSWKPPVYGAGNTDGSSRMIDTPRWAAAEWKPNTLHKTYTYWAIRGFAPDITVNACRGYAWKDAQIAEPEKIVELLPEVAVDILIRRRTDARKQQQAGVDQRRKWRDQRADLTKLIDASRIEDEELKQLIENLTKQIDARIG